MFWSKIDDKQSYKTLSIAQLNTRCQAITEPMIIMINSLSEMSDHGLI